MVGGLLLLTVSLSTVVIEGKVVDANTGKSLPYASIEIPGTSIGTASDSLGCFSLAGVPAGAFKVTASYLGYTPDTVTFNPAKYRSQLIFKLYPVALQLPAVEVISKRSAADIVEPGTALDLEELRETPGNFGDDILRSLPGLPGMGMSGNAWSGPAVVRGGETDENPVYYDGVEIPWAWHITGFNSIFNSDFVDSVALCISSIPIRYDALSGVTLVSSHKVLKRGGRFAYDALGLRGAVWSPIGSRADVALSLRKTTTFIKFGPLGAGFDPRFYDMALNAGYNISSSSRLEAGYLGSGDDFGTGEREKIALYRIGFKRLGVISFSSDVSYVHHHLSSGGSFFVPTVLYVHDAFTSLTETSWTPNERFEFLVGEELGIEKTSNATDRLRSTTYTHFALQIFSNLAVVTGVRLSNEAWTNGLKFAPRITLRYEPFDVLALSASYRDSYQHPFRTLRSSFYHEADLRTPSPLDTLYPGDWITLEAKRVEQYSFSVEIEPDTYCRFKVEAYHRDLSLLPLITQDSVWTSQGYGTGNGVEFSASFSSPIGLGGDIAYTLSGNKRMEGELTQLSWGDYDQRHMLNLQLRQRLPKDFLISAAFRLSTGRPYTPLVRDSTGNLIRGEVNSARAPLYKRLDLRIEKRLVDRPLSPYFYIEVINLLNTRGVYWMEEYVNSYNEIDTAFYGQIPFLPIFGVGGSF